MKNYIVATFILLFTLNTFGTEGKSIYGDDDRIDFNQLTNASHIQWALATAAMIPSYIIRESDDINVSKIKAHMLQQTGVCEYERFSRQLVAADCSGFLVSDKLLVTAGHCVRNNSDCKGWRWVFDYRQSENYKIGRTIKIANSSIYRCNRIVKRALNAKDDFAVIELDRPVVDREFLEVRRVGQLSLDEALTIVGHPSGLPVKVAPNAEVLSVDSSKSYFSASTDSFAGNSGSPVINSLTGVVEGILVRGEEDYHYENRNGKKCLVPTVCSQDRECEGEAVTKISIVLPFL